MNTVKFSYWVKQSVIVGLLLICVVLSKPVRADASPLLIAQVPLAVNTTAVPRVMLAMSRDHQLDIKAYTDYSDLNGDGIIDTTYNDNLDYYGYFDSKKCYAYTSGLFGPSGSAVGHQCSNLWSGNFLNWATMTRMDIIRKVLYGGYRYTDTATTAAGNGVTILERTLIPDDAHAFTKVYAPGSATDMQKYTPYAQTTISICNVTQGNQGLSKDINTSSTPPLMLVASGSWPIWANSQCLWKKNNNNNNLPDNDNNLVKKGENDGLTVRVKVCVSGLEETNCKLYTDTSNNAATKGKMTKKPTGLLQKYWESGKPIAFGLMTGSWGKNTAGGVLRYALPETSAPASLEINQNNGLIMSIGVIINTLDRFRISQYDFNKKQYQDCAAGDNSQCADWGNPLAEVYLETLRYLTGKGAATTAFYTDDSAYIASLPTPAQTWRDPINTDNWCASCSVIAISTVNSFDTDQLSNDLGISAATETDSVGALEGISGNYLIGSNGTDNNFQCTGKLLTNLSAAQGICSEAPSLHGGYDIAGLAYYARTHDMRPDETNYPGAQSINTYSVALGASLPRLGFGSITLQPACQANLDKNATSSSSNWQPCNMSDLIVENLHYDNSGNMDSGRFMVVWEDASWGDNYTMNGLERLAFCVGSACNPSVSVDSVKVTASVIKGQSDRAMRFGYTVSGSTNDGLVLPVLCPGKSNCNSVDPNPPVYSQGSSGAKLLENPLWYAAKYGGFDTIDSSLSNVPQSQSWDENADGVPDAFFNATNPALLESALDSILSNVASKLASSASAATNSTRLDTAAVLFQAKFDPATWNGQLLAYKINLADGSVAAASSWDAGEKVTAQGFSGRSVFSYNDASHTGINFVYSSLSDAQKTLITENQLNYIKGDQSNEKPSGTLRQRTGPHRLLGDIVNSDPRFINSISQGYDNLPGSEGSDYLKYITSPALTSRPPMLAVGANDGMLHVFDASIDTANSGKEIMAYAPSTVIGKLSALTLPTYIVGGNHQYFVDGSPVVGDAYFDADGSGSKEWRSALVGSLGAGGKGLFALDLTFLDPGNYKTAESTFSANRVLWEINNNAAPYASDLTDDAGSKRYGYANYLGLTMGQASIVRMANGNFAAVFGNGYNSVKQTAVLYIVDIKTGQLIRSLSTGVGDTTAVNGLATPLTADVNGDSIVDAIYAGDYQGNLWKFDVSDSNPDNWKVAFSTTPLFQATYTQFSTTNPSNSSQTLKSGTGSQPITAKPAFSKHPNGGIMIYFGTGKYFLTTDNVLSGTGTDPVETFYGIWDECVNFAGGLGACNKGPISSGKSQLVQQTIDYEGVTGSSTIRATSKNPVDYSTKKGWYMELYKGSGSFTAEKVISQAIVQDRTIIFASILPTARGLCIFGGTSWLTRVDALTGNSLALSAFSLTSVGNFAPITIEGTDYLISAIQSTVGMIDTPAVVATNGILIKLIASGSSGETEAYIIAGLVGGRQSWLQIR